MRCNVRASTSTLVGLPIRFSRISALFSLFLSVTMPLMPARGPSNIFTLSPAFIFMGFIFIRPVSGSIRVLMALMMLSGITASSVPKRTMLMTPRVERTGARFWVVAMAFRNR